MTGYLSREGKVREITYDGITEKGYLRKAMLVNKPGESWFYVSQTRETSKGLHSTRAGALIDAKQYIKTKMLGYRRLAEELESNLESIEKQLSVEAADQLA